MKTEYDEATLVATLVTVTKQMLADAEAAQAWVLPNVTHEAAPVLAPPSLVAVMDKAIKLIQQRWIKGQLNDKRGGHCLLGGLQTAGTIQGWHRLRPAYLAVQAAIRDYFPDRLAPVNTMSKLVNPVEADIAHFNDVPDTTQEDVLLVLKHARVMLEEMEAGDA